MLARNIQMPGNHPKERIQHSEHGESLRSSEILVLEGSDNLLAKFTNSVHSCGQHRVVTTRLISELPGGVITFSKIFTLLGAHS